MLSSSSIKRIQTYFAHEPVRVVYLFGSRAKGRTHPQSDYDFGILFQQDLTAHERFDKRLEYIGQLGKIVKSDNVDVVDVSAAPVYLQYSVIAARQDIVCKNESCRIDFEHRVLSKYFDRLPYIRRHAELSIASIAQYGLYGREN